MSNTQRSALLATRRAVLREIAQEVGGTIKLANLLDKNPTQISHIIGTNSTKNIGDKLAADIEKKLGLQKGGLDSSKNLAISDVEANATGEMASSILKQISAISQLEHKMDETAKRINDIKQLRQAMLNFSKHIAYNSLYFLELLKKTDSSLKNELEPLENLIKQERIG
jgi:hypothetical protein